MTATATEIKLQPADCWFRIDEVKLAEPTEEGRKPRFEMVVHTGQLLDRGWLGKLIVNLEGITWGDKKHVPALLDHDPTLRLGYTTKLYLEDGVGLKAEGIMLSNDQAQQVRADSADGFPWEASCYLQATKVLQLEEGATHTVNGIEIEGPAMVFEECRLREVTFTALGADSNTSAQANLGEGAEAIRASLSTLAPETMSKNDTKTAPAQPAEAPVDTEAVRLEAREAEKKRANTILSAAADVQLELARELVASDKSTEDALLALNEDLRKRLSERAPTAPTPASAPLAAPAPEQPEAELTPDEQWERDPKLHEEFGTKSVFLAFLKNKNRSRSVGGGV